MTLPLELGGIHDDNVRRALELVGQHFPIRATDLANDVPLLGTTGTARKLDFGAGTVTFTASASSATNTINHSVGTTPVSVVATSSGPFIVMLTFSFTSTQFSVQAFAPGGATTGTFGFTWIAIG